MEGTPWVEVRGGSESRNCWNGRFLQMFAQLLLSGTSSRLSPLGASAQSRHYDTNAVSGVGRQLAR